MNILPDIRLTIDGVNISILQLQALIAIATTRSQNKAAQTLGISVPVLHRRIKDLEEKLGIKLILGTPRGTVLSEHGNEMVNTYKRYQSRLKNRTNPCIACSPLYSHLIMEVVSPIEREGHQIDMFVGDDMLNKLYLDMGLVDIVVFDDPIYVHREKEAYEYYEVAEVVKDTLIHVNMGKKYIRYKYGAQRIGFSNLDIKGKKYKIVRETRDYNQLLKSGHSFFINRSLAKREGLDLQSQTEPSQLMHSIFALNVGKGDELDLLMRKLDHYHEK
ncbi:MAG: LysR family transcriptional regulator [Thermoplasmata archaeon]|nr:MAG: LysR family transcriptional regulator [Thermoplasmata archaeon]